MVVTKESVNFPMISTSSWWTLRKKFIQTLPARLTTNTLASMFNTTPKSASVNLLSPLKKMGLVDDEGKTTERARRWRDDDQYPLVCKEIREEVYPQDLLDTFSEHGSSRAAIERWFANEAGVGESAKQKMTTLYLLLIEADPTKQDSSSNASKTTKSTKSVSSPPSKSGTLTMQKGGNRQDEKVHTLVPRDEEQRLIKHNVNSIEPSLHIDIQIHIASDASAEQIDHIFSSMSKHLYKGRNVND